MVDEEHFPPLKPLHSDSALNAAKLAKFDLLSTEVLLASLTLEEEGCLKTRRDGTILDGHHRVYVLRSRGVDVDKGRICSFIADKV
jgi:hypothetical protein